jgi:hypothetical protein
LIRYHRLTLDSIADGALCSTYLPWIESITHIKAGEEEELELRLNSNYENVWRMLKQRLDEPGVRLKSRYSARLYQWAKQYRVVGYKRVSLATLRKILGLEADEADREAIAGQKLAALVAERLVEVRAENPHLSVEEAFGVLEARHPILFVEAEGLPPPITECRELEGREVARQIEARLAEIRTANPNLSIAECFGILEEEESQLMSVDMSVPPAARSVLVQGIRY